VPDRMPGDGLASAVDTAAARLRQLQFVRVDLPGECPGDEGTRFMKPLGHAQSSNTLCTAGRYPSSPTQRRRARRPVGDNLLHSLPFTTGSGRGNPAQTAGSLGKSSPAGRPKKKAGSQWNRPVSRYLGVSFRRRRRRQTHQTACRACRPSSCRACRPSSCRTCRPSSCRTCRPSSCRTSRPSSYRTCR
jgi:hypothetical protein